MTSTVAVPSTVISFIRTYAGIGIGALLAWVGTRFHLVVSPHTQAALVILAVALVQAAYYALVRLLEHYFPNAGALLGIPAKPTYAAIGADGAAVITDLEADFTGPDPLAIVSPTALPPSVPTAQAGAPAASPPDPAAVVAAQD